MATSPRALPANPFTGHVPEPFADVGSLTFVVKAIKQNIEILTGDRGQFPNDRAVLFSDLAAYGLVDASVFTLNSVVSTTSTTPTGPAGGDLAGVYPNPTVGQINGAGLGSTVATSGNLLIGSGTQWVTKAVTGDLTITSAGATTVGKINGATLGTTTATSGNLLIGSGTAWVTNAMSGDITITSAGVTAIGANKVTLAKLATQAATTVLANATGGAAVPTAVTLAGGLSFSGTTITDQWSAGNVTVLGTNLSITGTTLNATTGSGTVLQGYLGGLGTSFSSTTVLGIAAGMASSDDNSTLLTLGSAYTKTTGAWAVGTANGGLDTGTIANTTWYHVYVIERTDTSVVDILFSTSASAPTMPANYTKKRRIGSFLTDGSAHIVSFVQNGNRFDWSTPINNITTTPGHTTADLRVLSVPTGVIVEAIVTGNMSDSAAAAAGLYLSNPAQTDVAFSAAAFTCQCSAVVNGLGAYQTTIVTDTSAQIRSRVSTTTAAILISVQGWIDRRGQF